MDYLRRLYTNIYWNQNSLNFEVLNTLGIKSEASTPNVSELESNSEFIKDMEDSFRK